MIERLHARAGAETSSLFLGLQVWQRGPISSCGQAEPFSLFYSDNGSRGTHQEALICPETERRQWPSQCHCPHCLSGITRANLRLKERKKDLYIS